eukprot:2810749-Rhodomonas_salina.1
MQAISDATAAAENRECFNCHEISHIRPNCPHPRAQPTLTNTPHYPRRGGRGSALRGMGGAPGGRGAALGGRGAASGGRGAALIGMGGAP